MSGQFIDFVEVAEGDHYPMFESRSPIYNAKDGKELASWVDHDIRQIVIGPRQQDREAAIAFVCESARRTYPASRKQTAK